LPILSGPSENEGSHEGAGPAGWQVEGAADIHWDILGHVLRRLDLGIGVALRVQPGHFADLRRHDTWRGGGRIEERPRHTRDRRALGNRGVAIGIAIGVVSDMLERSPDEFAVRLRLLHDVQTGETEPAIAVENVRVTPAGPKSRHDDFTSSEPGMGAAWAGRP
jgi:hypothetical protein